MPKHDEHHLRIDGAHVVWNGITNPEAMDPSTGGGMKYNVKVVIPPHSPDLALIEQFATQEFQNGDFRGVWPAGGIWPVKQAQENEFNGMFPGWTVLNATTYNTPQVFDEHGNQLDPMQYGQLIYGNQCVNILVHFKSYNNKSKGIAARLDGLQIVTSAQAPMVNFGGVNAAAAFGGAPAAAPAPTAPAAPAAPAPAPGAPSLPPQPQPGAYPPPQAGQAPNHPPQGPASVPGAPAPAPGAPVAGAPVTPGPAPGAPVQAAPGAYMPPGAPTQ